MNRKYKILLDDIETTSNGTQVYRIIAVRSFGDVKVGDLGGYIQNEGNLSHDDYCWVYDDAKVANGAKVSGNAQVSKYAEVLEGAKVFGDAQVSGEARVYNKALVCDSARVYGNAEVYGNAQVGGYLEVCQNAKVHGNAKLYSMVKVFGTAEVSDAYIIDPIDIQLDTRITSQEDLLEYTKLVRRK